jgi:hypothetical protein
MDKKDRPIQQTISHSPAFDGVGNGTNGNGKNGDAHAVVDGDPTRLEAPDGVSEKTVVRKW